MDKFNFTAGQIISDSDLGKARFFCKIQNMRSKFYYLERILTEKGICYKLVLDDGLKKNPELVISELTRLNKYLDSTDWYVTRQMETGTPTPADVRVKRMAAREKISQLREQLKDQDKGDQ